jgi:hypothetical protein
MAKQYKLQVELNPTQLAMLDELQQIGELRTKKELLDNAFTLLKWAVQQKKEGRLIVSMDPKTMSGRELELPYLQRVEYAERLVANERAAEEERVSATVPN